MKAIKEAVVRLFGREDPLTNQEVNILNNKEIENKEGYPLSVETTKASLFFVLINEERARIEKEVGYKLKFMDLKGSDGTQVDVYFNGEDVDFLDIKVRGWNPYVPPEAVEKLLEKYESRNRYSISLIDDLWNTIFGIDIYRDKEGFEVGYNGKYKLKQDYKRLVEKMLEALGIEYEETEDKIRIEKHQKNVDITPSALRNVYELVAANDNNIYIHIFDLKDSVSISNSLIGFSYVKPEEVDEIEKFLNNYEKSLYKLKYKVIYFSKPPEEEPEENTIKFVWATCF